MTDHGDKHEMDDIGCIEAINGLYAYLDGEIDDPEMLAKIEHHLGHCRTCYSRHEMELALTDHIRESAKDKAPENLQDRLRTLIDKL